MARRAMQGLLALGLGLAGCSSSGLPPAGGTTGSAAASSGSSGSSGVGGTSSGASGTSGTVSGATTGTASSGSGASSGTTGVADAGPPKPPGAPCQTDTGCLSGLCGTNQVCCQPQCHADVAACAASCGPGTGACDYPDAGQVCAASLCVAGGLLPAAHCDGAGNCPTPALGSCGGFACSDPSTCYSSCSSDAQCAPGNSCDRADGGGLAASGRCVSLLPPGAACAEPANCASNACLSGHCCVSGCPTQDPICGATSCDAHGACGPLAAAGTACFGATCDGTNYAAPLTCDGQGACGQPSPQACTPFSCNASGCLSSCANDRDCDATDVDAYCNGNLCCTFAQSCNGGQNCIYQLNIDGAAGVDAPCCGTATGGPCHSLTYAMGQLDSYNQTHANNAVPPYGPFLLNATLSDGTSDWPAANETWPVKLGYGAALMAPGIYFSSPEDGGPLFRIAKYAAEPAPSVVTIEGSIINGVSNQVNVVIGSDSLGNLTKAPTAIEVDGPETLDLAGATVYGAACRAAPCAATSAIQLRGGGLLLGYDYQSLYGPVSLGGPLPISNQKVASGANGIVCSGADAGITDLPPGNGPSGPSFTVQGMRAADLEIDEGCSLNLGAPDQLGVAPTAPGGLGSCFNSPKLDSVGILARGSAAVTLNTLNISCQDRYGLELLPDDAGLGPTVTSLAGQITNCGCAGVYAGGGSLTVNTLNLGYNQLGLEQTGLASVAMFGSSLGCDSKVEPSTVCHTSAGIDVLDLATLGAEGGGNSWTLIPNGPAGATQQWRCLDAPQFQHCTCVGPSCPSGTVPLPDKSPVVYTPLDVAIPPTPVSGATVSAQTTFTCN